MSQRLIVFPNAERQSCFCCGAQRVTSAYETEHFNYQTESGEVVTLSARVPVWSCPDCREQYTDERAEDIRHEAVCKFLGRLTPKELKEIRENVGLSQSEWASLTGIGIASIKRWETGSLIQGAALDGYLRLLRDERNIYALKRSRAATRDHITPTFRTALSDIIVEGAAAFKLRPIQLLEAAG